MYLLVYILLYGKIVMLTYSVDDDEGLKGCAYTVCIIIMLKIHKNITVCISPIRAAHNP